MGKGDTQNAQKDMQIPVLKKNFCIIYPLYEPMASLELRFPPPGCDDSMSHSQWICFLLNKKANILKPTATTHAVVPFSYEFTVICRFHAILVDTHNLLDVASDSHVVSCLPRQLLLGWSAAVLCRPLLCTARCARCARAADLILQMWPYSLSSLLPQNYTDCVDGWRTGGVKCSLRRKCSCFLPRKLTKWLWFTCAARFCKCTAGQYSWLQWLAPLWNLTFQLLFWCFQSPPLA